MLSTPASSQASVYNDFSEFSKLKIQAKTDSPAALQKVAKQFEALFLNNILKGMRTAKLADGAFDSEQSKTYNEMYDQQLSVHLSGKPGVGLADLIVKQLSPKGENPHPESLEEYLNNPVSLVKTPDGNILNGYRDDDDNDEMPFKNGRSVPIQSAVDFVRQLQPLAQQAAKGLGIDPNALLAQAALESGWGNAVIKNSDGSSSHNLFNIKADRSWRGKQAQVSALEFDQGIARRMSSGFRAYPSFQESFHDYVHFIKNNPRYESALAKVDNTEQYMRELQRAGYATDPSYAAKVMHIYKSNTLNLFANNSAVAMK
ncbi:MAG: flagellar assembly peptidoglycan hydrolase FlgJ [Methylococcales bacterium]|nr:flagellar assembly peptidoglycan hydrolase FlgJ [Methylococcales bacterium]MDD5753562.1 flagellar assembly peptidoglycan hydrolase FlgJ [Methylococcales bacterium]